VEVRNHESARSTVSAPMSSLVSPCYRCSIDDVSMEKWHIRWLQSKRCLEHTWKVSSPFSVQTSSMPLVQGTCTGG
jgi:hypothetical protein